MSDNMEYANVQKLVQLRLQKLISYLSIKETIIMY